MSSLQEKAQAIRLLILDVDGILTSGVIYFVADDTEVKGFHVHDGQGIKLLQQAGIAVAIISSRKSVAVKKRAHELGITHCYLGHADKKIPYSEIKQKLQLNDTEIAYMGDDLPDLPLLRQAGLAITVPEAPAIIQQHADLITKKSGGQGAVREICELLLEAQDCYQSVLEFYLN